MITYNCLLKVDTQGSWAHVPLLFRCWNPLETAQWRSRVWVQVAAWGQIGVKWGL